MSLHVKEYEQILALKWLYFKHEVFLIKIYFFKNVLKRSVAFMLIIKELFYTKVKLIGC